MRRLEGLRRCFVTAREFIVAFAFFDDYVGTCPELFPNSERGANDALRLAVHACTTAAQPSFSMVHAMMSRVRGTDFWHGICHGASAHVVFFYFERLGMGLATVCQPSDPRAAVHLLRFSVSRTAGEATAGWAPPPSA